MCWSCACLYSAAAWQRNHANQRGIRYLSSALSWGLLPQRDNVRGLAIKREIWILTCKRHITPDTLSALQILQCESHPNVFNQGPGKISSRGKEDFSLYGLFHQHILTPQGKGRLKQYFLRPSTQPDVILERQDVLSILLLPPNAPVVQKLTASLKKIKNMRPVITSLHKGLSSGKATFGGLKGTIWTTLLNVC